MPRLQTKVHHNGDVAISMLTGRFMQTLNLADAKELESAPCTICLVSHKLLGRISRSYIAQDRDNGEMSLQDRFTALGCHEKDTDLLE